MAEENKNGVEVLETKQFKILCRFQDGEVDGKPHDRVYGFAIEAKSEPEAKEILRRHLAKCLLELEKTLKE